MSYACFQDRAFGKKLWRVRRISCDNIGATRLSAQPGIKRTDGYAPTHGERALKIILKSQSYFRQTPVRRLCKRWTDLILSREFRNPNWR